MTGDAGEGVGRAQVEALFTLAYGRRPAVVASAPGRVNLIGEHTDYNGGAVLPIAIAQRTWVAMGHSRDGESRAVSRERGEAGAWRHADARAAHAWWDYVAGALVAAEALGGGRGAREVAVASDVPMGAGLSSSASLEVATIFAALALEGVPMDAAPAAAGGGAACTLREVALAAHRAESEFVGVACGIMDQFASALCREGHALHLRCDTQEARAVPFARGVLIVDTLAPRALVASAFNTRRAECDAALAILRTRDPGLRALARATPQALADARLPPPLDRRARHVVSENQRVHDFVQECAAGGMGERLGRLLNASHRSLRDDYECSSPELDWIVEHCVARVGIAGARLTGAGWGGCAIVVGEEEALRSVVPDLSHAFERAWGRAPRTWLTRPNAGARIEASA
ncbi:MAG: galactokinase [Gemmatimonadota bacterium]